MPLINHDYKNLDLLERLIIKEDGTPLHGEIDMYRRIFSDCQKSEYTWHFWHDLRLPLSVRSQSCIQIDFLLVCEKGAVVVEVKGGGIGVNNGKFYFKQGDGEYMARSPFDQAEDYQYALMHHGILNAHAIYIDTVCAFPHEFMDKTNDNPKLDKGYKLWSAYQQGDECASFADFCIEVLDVDKVNWRGNDLTKEELAIAINALTPTIRSHFSFSEESLKSIIDWLEIQNLDLFQSLSKNQRIVFEGGPGTGKTTLAKAFIRKHKDLNGLYLCWNKLLAENIKNELELVNLGNCKVIQYASFLLSLDPEHKYLTYEDITGNNDLSNRIQALMENLRQDHRFIPYDYIIIDEAQDVFDMGAATVLDALTSIRSNGLETGRYLVFYDTEQGYRKDIRLLDDYADDISRFGTYVILDENKRVRTNKQIIEYANRVLLSDDNVDASAVIRSIESENDTALHISHLSGYRAVIQSIKDLVAKIKDNNNWRDYVLLLDSHTKRILVDEEDTIYDRIADLEIVKELTVENLHYSSNKLQFTSILSYKGLECKHVVLLLSNKEQIDKFELYVGMSRAIFDLEIFLLD